MTIIIKHVLRNIKSKKLLSFLIILSVAVSSAMLFVALSISGSLTGIYEKTLRDAAGKSDILISPEQRMSNVFFHSAAGQKKLPSADFLPEIEVIGMYESASKSAEWLSVYAVRPADLNRLYNMEISEGTLVANGNQIIISDDTAAQFSLKLHDTIKVSINGVATDFEIAGIARSSGLFSGEARTKNAVIPLKTAQGILNCGEEVNSIHVFLNGNTTADALIKLTDAYPNLTVDETVSQKDIDSSSGSFSMTFFLMFAASCGMCIFIIYSSFRVVTTERLETMGTFRSIGASKRKSNLILFLEIAVYGVISGILAIVLGIILLLVISNQLMTSGGSTEISTINLTITFAFSVILSLLCSISPVRAAAKIPIKDIILRTGAGLRKGNSTTRFIIGASLLALGLFIPTLSVFTYNMAVILLALVFVFCGIVLVIPFLTGTLTTALQKLFPNRLSPKNLRKSKGATSIITLITIGMAVILMISDANLTMNRATEDAFALLDYQIEATGIPSDEALEKDISAIPGVEIAGGVYVKTDVEITGFDDLKTVYGMDRQKVETLFRYTLQGPLDELWSAVERGRSILISEDYINRFSLKIGDEIELIYKGSKHLYKIAGIINEMQNTGNVAFISEKNFKSDFNAKSYRFIAVKTLGDIQKVEEEIKSVLWDKQLNLTALSDIQQETREINQTVFMILTYISLLAALIGIIGIVNNLVISFMERKRSLAMLRAVGMSRRSCVKMISAEAGIIGLIGGTLGFFGGMCLSQTIPFVLRLFEFPANSAPFNPVRLIVCLVIGIILCVAAGISPMIKTTKLNIVNSIKYE